MLDAGYEEDMSISNTKIGSCVSRQPGAQPGLSAPHQRCRPGAAHLRNSAAGAVLPEAVPRELLAAGCVRGCVLFVEHRAAGEPHLAPARAEALTPVSCAGVRIFQREGLYFVHASETGAWLVYAGRFASPHAGVPRRARRNNPGLRFLRGWASILTSTFSRCGLAATPSRPNRCAGLCRDCGVLATTP